MSNIKKFEEFLNESSYMPMKRKNEEPSLWQQKNDYAEQYRELVLSCYNHIAEFVLSYGRFLDLKTPKGIYLHFSPDHMDTDKIKWVFFNHIEVVDDDKFFKGVPQYLVIYPVDIKADSVVLDPSLIDLACLINLVEFCDNLKDSQLMDV